MIKVDITTHNFTKGEVKYDVKDSDGNVLEDAIAIDDQNNIKVKVEASDNASGSGIKEYVYL